MATFPADPLADGIEAYGRRLRRRETTVVKTVEAYLARIAAVDGRIQSYEHVAKDLALAEARAADALIAAGTDLGPLMGVPVGVKDLLAVDGTPTTAGSRLDVRKQIGAEGPFVKRLKALGCIILGKTKTVEFAIGGTGISGARGCPWNPWDAKVQRTPGGSSSGSGAAMAAGLCGFAIGSDTGGSVRSPAGFCGTFGLKTTKGRWPTEGVFPLSRTLDTLGLLTRSAADAAIVLAAYEGLPAIDPAPPRGIRLGRPRSYFFDELEPDVRRCLEAAIDRLAKAGVVIDDTDVPEADIGPEFRPFIATELVAELGGREGFAASRAQIDPVIAKRVETGTKSMADEYVRLMWRHEELVRLARGWMEGFDGWICPGNPYMAKPLTDYDDPATENTISYIVSRTNRLANLFGLCAIVSPVQQLGAKLPVPLQVMCPGGNDVEALAIGRTIEAVLGVGPTPDIAAFAAKVAA